MLKQFKLGLGTVTSSLTSMRMRFQWREKQRQGNTLHYHGNARCFLAAVYIVAALGVVKAQLPECRHTFPDGNTFDLSGLRKPAM